MNENKSLDQLLDQLGDLLQKLQDHQKPLEEIPPEALQKLEVLELIMSTFDELNRRSFEISGIDIDQIYLDALQSSDTPPKIKQLLERSNHMEKDAKRLYNRLSKVVEETKQPSDEENTKKQAREHQKKFKRLGGTGWIPL